MAVEFRNKVYRDDRLVVFNVTKCIIRDVYGGMDYHNKREGWAGHALENTDGFFIPNPPLNTQSFEDIESARKYAIQSEPRTGLISNNGEPLNIPEQLTSEEEIYLYYNNWLQDKGLFSCLEGYPDNLKQHCSFAIDSQGYNYHHAIMKITHHIDGIEKFYYENGNLKHEISWYNQQKNGPQKDYFENGTVYISSAHSDNELHGKYERYHENNQLRSLGQFENGEQVGHWEWYDEDGNLIETKDFTS